MHTLHLIAAVAGAVCVHAMLRLWRNREAPGAMSCLLMFTAVGIYVSSVLTPTPPLALLYVGYTAGTAITPLLLVSVVEYAGLQPRYWSRWRWLVVLVPLALGCINIVRADSALFSAIATADPASRAALVQAARQEPLLTTNVIAYLLNLALLGTVTLALLRASARRRDMIVLAVIAFLVTAADVLYQLTGVTLAGTTPTPYALLAGLVLACLGLYRSNMFDLRPIARNVLIDSVRDAMMVVDAQRRVIDCNRTAAERLGGCRSELIGRPATELLPREFTAMLQCTVHLRAELAVEAGSERIWFEVDVTPLELRRRPAGHLLIARDISERRLVQDALEESRRALEAANVRLVEQSLTDSLTGLKNRRFLFQCLNEEMNRHHRAGTMLGLLLLDLDHFKAVNDTHGHPVGDEALIQVACALQSSVRDCDVVARLGGEEFAILAVDTAADGLLSLAERVRQAIARTTVAPDSDRPMMLTASIGIAVAGPDSRSADGLFAEADRYLYAAKHQGRNRVAAPPTNTAEARSAG